jgi:fibronectin-binding autotransporter adhesin
VTAGSFAVVGDQKSATGMLTVKGTGSQLAFSSFLDIASAGAGTLVASGGASLSVSSFCNMGDQKGANAYMKITDSGTSAQFSSFFTAGIAGNAEVDVLNGASVSFATGFTLAQSATGAGTLTVDGTSTVDSSMAAAYVGGAGSGSLNITGGGVLSASDLFVASQANATAMSSVIVDGAGSQLNIAGDVNLGQKGNATGSIRDSGSFSCNTAEVGSGTTGFGYITVQDSGQWSIASDLTIGQSGDGNVTLQGGGTIMVGGNLDIAQKPGSLGNLTVDGGMSDLDFNMGTVTIGDAGTGSMTLQNGAVVDLGISQGVTVGSQATGVGTLVVTASPGGMPSAGGAGTPAEIDITSLIVGASGKGTVLVNSGATMVIYGDLTLGQNANSAGTLTVDGGATDLNLTGEDATSNVAIGESGAGTMTIQNGADVDLTNTNPVDVGQQSTAKGTLTVTGTDTNLDTSDLTIGEAGSGTLMVNSTANLATFGNVALGVEQNANGTATVTGGQTQWSLSGFTTVGEGGNGTLNITAGGVVDATLADSVFPLIVGDDTTGAGTIMISDANSMLTSAGDVIVGEYGAGTVSIVDNGAMVVTGNLNIGSLSTGNGLVTVGAMGIGGGDLQAASTGSLSVGNGLSVGTVGKGDLELDGGTVTLNAKGSGSLVIGDAGTGTIAIYEGTLNAAGASSILLGNQTTGNGTLIIDGPDSSFNFGSVPITVGVHGTGTLKVTDGGQFTIGSLALGAQQGSTGNLIVDGSGASGVTTLVSASQLIVGGSDADIMSQSGGTGSVTVQNGGQLTSVDAFISQSTGSSQSAVKVTDANSSWTINDNLSIGVSDSGTLTVANGGSVSVRNALTVGTAPALSALNLQGAPGNSGTSQTTMSYGSGISIGNNGAGMVSITGGAILNDLSTTATDYIGQNSGAGTVTVQGGGSTWTTGMLEMNGNGTLASSLNILSGGAVNSKAGVNIQTSNGTILVDGKGNGTPSSWTIGINQGDANYLWAPMTISNGASVSCLGAIYLGDPIPNGPGGTISIQTGGQLSLTSSSFLDLKVDNVVVDAGTLSCPGGVDFAGQSPVTVSNGGVIATGTEGGYAAIDCPLTVQNGGSLNVQTAAVLGDNGYSGSLEIASGGTAMIANNLVVGSAVRGFLQVDGGGSLTVGGVLAISGPITIQSFVMNDRTASVTANGFTIGAYNGPGNNVPQSVSFGGGSITVTGTTQVGDGTSASSLTLTSSAAQLSTGNLVVSTNSSVLLQGGATITASSLTTQQSGTLDVRGGAMTVGTGPQGALGTVTIFKGAVANLAGYLLGTKVIVGGTLAPGNSDPPTIDANLEIDSGGVLDMVINSDTGNTSHLTVTGTTTVAGKVLLDFQHGFAPKAGDSFDLFTVSGGMSALGTDIEVAGLASGWQYSVQDQSGDTYVDSMSDGVATSPEPPSAVGLILLGCASLRRPRRA